MLISRDEVREIEETYDRVWKRAIHLHRRAEEEGVVRPGFLNSRPWVGEAEAAENFNSWNFWLDRPHLFMPVGFDEFRDLGDMRDASARFEAAWSSIRADRRMNDRERLALMTRCYMPTRRQMVFRTSTGSWHVLDRMVAGSLPFRFLQQEKPGWIIERNVDQQFAGVGESDVSLEDLIQILYEKADKWQESESRLVAPLPSAWTGAAQALEIHALGRARDLIQAIRTTGLPMSEVSWEELEWIVEEILRKSGMEVHLNRKHPQGGRDIVARGEMVPGWDPITLAVEVKHRKVVGRPEVQKALYQNRHYPALMFFTSGRFTAGVLKEQELNHLRLILKDGVALGDMIRSYPLLGSPSSRENVPW